MLSDGERDVDFCIVGTGLVECIAAAAFALRGYSVIHLDPHNYYGGDWASHNYHSLVNWSSSSKRPAAICVTGDDNTESTDSRREVNSNDGNECGGKDVVSEFGTSSMDESYKNSLGNFSDATCKKEVHLLDLDVKKCMHHTTGCYGRQVMLSIAPLVEDEAQRECLRRELESHSSRFNFDCTPRVVYACSPIVDLLIASGASQYLDFRAVSGVDLLEVEEHNTSSKSQNVDFESKNVDLKSQKVDLLGSSSVSDADNNSQCLISSAVVRNVSSDKLGLIHRTVPMSKGDVFEDSILTAREKRVYMKFVMEHCQYLSSSAVNLFASPAKLYLDRTNIPPPTHQDNPQHIGATTETSDAITTLTATTANTATTNTATTNTATTNTATTNTATTNTATANTADNFCDGPTTSIDTPTSWIQFLNDKQLTKRLQNYITYGICMSSMSQQISPNNATDGNAWTKDTGLQKMKLLISSLGIYRNSGALLFPIYGCGDLPQVFARTTAVHGGTYVLRTGITRISLLDENSINCGSGIDTATAGNINTGKDQDRDICEESIAYSSEGSSADTITTTATNTTTTTTNATTTTTNATTTATNATTTATNATTTATPNTDTPNTTATNTTTTATNTTTTATNTATPNTTATYTDTGTATYTTATYTDTQNTTTTSSKVTNGIDGRVNLKRRFSIALNNNQRVSASNIIVSSDNYQYIANHINCTTVNAHGKSSNMCSGGTLSSGSDSEATFAMADVNRGGELTAVVAERVARMFVVTRHPLIVPLDESRLREDGQTRLAVVPPDVVQGIPNPIHVLQLGEGSGCCPPGYYLTHFAMIVGSSSHGAVANSEISQEVDREGQDSKGGVIGEEVESEDEVMGDGIMKLSRTESCALLELLDAEGLKKSHAPLASVFMALCNRRAERSQNCLLICALFEDPVLREAAKVISKGKDGTCTDIGLYICPDPPVSPLFALTEEPRIACNLVCNILQLDKETCQSTLLPQSKFAKNSDDVETATPMTMLESLAAQFANL